MSDRPPRLSDGERYRRERALACLKWGTTPWDFDRANAAGLVTDRDVADLVLLLRHDVREAGWVEQYLFAAEAAEAEARRQAEEWDAMNAASWAERRAAWEERERQRREAAEGTEVTHDC